MEIGRSLGRLLERGWRPERTIVLAGWDGEEYGLLGSTEWGEQFRRDLGATPSPTSTWTASPGASSAPAASRRSTR